MACGLDLGILSILLLYPAIISCIALDIRRQTNRQSVEFVYMCAAGEGEAFRVEVYRIFYNNRSFA